MDGKDKKQEPLDREIKLITRENWENCEPLTQEEQADADRMLEQLKQYLERGKKEK